MPSDQELSPGRKILLVDDDQDFRWATSNVLRLKGYDVLQAKDGEEALNFIDRDIPELILLDKRMPGKDGLEVAQEMMQRLPAVPIIMITAYGDVKSAVKAMKLGVYDYVTKPVDNNDLIFTIERPLEKQGLVKEVEQLRRVLDERSSLYDLMGKSDEIKGLIDLVEKVASTSFTVLIEGESGSGKELVARAIHDLSDRKEGPFVAVDCGAIPETLIESELFGYMKGAFTGADTDKPGQFELSEGGTLLLDEVGNLPYQAQQKLLRTMQERVIQRLGAKKVHPVDVRIIAATNQRLEKGVETGDFRSDLFFRLKEFVIRVPPLRERRSDLSYLTKKFIDEAEEELNKKCRGLSKQAVSLLFRYQWPGNVRELRNIVRQAVLLCDENRSIRPENLMFSGDLMPEAGGGDAFEDSQALYDGTRPLRQTVKAITDDLEKKLIKQAMAEADGNKSEAARRLEIDYKTLLRKIKVHQIE